MNRITLFGLGLIHLVLFLFGLWLVFGVIIWFGMACAYVADPVNQTTKVVGSLLLGSWVHLARSCIGLFLITMAVNYFRTKEQMEGMQDLPKVWLSPEKLRIRSLKELRD